MRLIRVFPRRTKATPKDNMAFVGDPPLFRPEADAVHISCTFTWDKKEAERLAEAWGRYYPKAIVGGPAYDDPGDTFVPGRYVGDGYVITSRGCPNSCKFCFVPRREGALRVLPIRSGWNVLDNNLLACPRPHIEAVLDMLSRHPHRAAFTGGLEAARLEPWFVRACAWMGAERLYFAYDSPTDKAPLRDAAALIAQHWPEAIARHKTKRISCYVLCGYAGDTVKRALRRVEWVKSLRITPQAMLFQPENSNGIKPVEWRAFCKEWSRPRIIWSRRGKCLA